MGGRPRPGRPLTGRWRGAAVLGKGLRCERGSRSGQTGEIWNNTHAHAAFIKADLLTSEELLGVWVSPN